MAQKEDKGGRPPTYDESYHPDEAYELIVEMGANNAKLARKFHVHKGTINKWLAHHEEFRNRVLEAQALWNTGELKVSLQQRAKGYQFTETTRELIGSEMFITKKVTKHIVPDTPALKFALTNYAPGEFAERQELKVETPDTLELTINTGVKEVVKK